MTFGPHLFLTLLLTWTDLKGRRRVGFLVGFTTSESHPNGTIPLSPIAWSSHRVKRSVSASLAGEVFMMSECIRGVLESAMYRDYDPTLHGRRSIHLPDEPTVTAMKADSAILTVEFTEAFPPYASWTPQSALFDHFIRESTAGHCRRTAQELRVIRLSIDQKARTGRDAGCPLTT